MRYPDSAKKNKPLTKLFTSFIRFYKSFISPLLPYSCRYHPTCSTYTIEAMENFGPFKGAWMGFKRILRCNPLFKGGYDPVKKSKKNL